MKKWTAVMLFCSLLFSGAAPALAGDEGGHGGSEGTSHEGQLTLHTALDASAFGHWQGADGSLQFSSDASIPWVVRTEILVNGKRFAADVDYDQGVLFLDGGNQILNESDMTTVLGAYRSIETTELAEEDQFALLFVYKSLGFLAESPRDFVHSPFWTTLPRIVSDGHGESHWVGIGHDDPTGPTGPTGPTNPDDEGCFLRPSCAGGGLTDSNPSTIRCVEHGFYYCSEWDYYPNGILSPEQDVTSSAPAVPPTWSDAEAAGIYVWGGPQDGAVGCTGRCGPDCSGAGPIIGGGGGWGLGCLIHDQCVWQASGGNPSQWDKSPFSFDCGGELRDAADDHYMPPGFCPGTTTVGGVGLWPRGWWVLHEPTLNVVSAARLPDSGPLGLLRRECADFICDGVNRRVDGFSCEQAYSSLLDQCEDCNRDFFFDATRGGTVTTVETFHACAQLQCPNFLPDDLTGYQHCVRQDWAKEDDSWIRGCMLGETNICSVDDCANDFCAFEFDAFQQAGPGGPEESLWTWCRSMCQGNGYCDTSSPACSYRDCLESVCADEGMPPGVACITSEEGGVGNILVSYIHRQCIQNDGC